MLPERTAKIIRDFCEFIGGDTCSQWHIGVTAQTKDYLFKELNMAPDFRWYIYRHADSAMEAHAIAKAFWNIECQKSPLSTDSRDDSAVFVFAHRAHPFLTGPEVDGQARVQGIPSNVSP